MSTAPTLNGQVIGQAERATRAILDRLLTRMGATFHHWVALNLTTNGQTIERHEITRQMTQSLKIDERTAQTAIDELVSAALLEAVPGDEHHVRLTAAGRARHLEIRAAIAEVTARLYRDLPADDLATAGRVLTIITGRANAELAAG
jgi:DNA-binding MarR family transcriptional regulator